MVQTFKNILVTVGTTQFDQLIQSLLSPETISTLLEIGCQKLTIQYGKFRDLNTLNLFKTIPNIDVKLFDYNKSLHNFIEEADLVIGHAGAGTSLEVLRLGKPLLIVINDCLMNNHQKELAIELSENNFAIFSNVENLSDKLKSFDKNNLKPFPQHNPNLFKNFLLKLMEEKIY